MKYILILLVSFAFGQGAFNAVGFFTTEIDTPIQQEEIVIDNPRVMKSVKGYDLVIHPPIIERCIGLNIGLIGSLEDFKKIHDAYECEFRADVAITINDTTQYYTFEEFLERLGFKEK